MINGLLRNFTEVQWANPQNNDIVGERSDVFLTKKEVAIRCRVSLQSVNNWITKNGLIKYKVGSRVLIKESDLESFMLRVDG